jgi:hypothetical protein
MDMYKPKPKTKLPPKTIYVNPLSSSMVRYNRFLVGGTVDSIVVAIINAFDYGDALTIKVDPTKYDAFMEIYGHQLKLVFGVTIVSSYDHGDLGVTIGTDVIIPLYEGIGEYSNLLYHDLRVHSIATNCCVPEYAAFVLNRVGDIQRTSSSINGVDSLTVFRSRMGIQEGSLPKKGKKIWAVFWQTAKRYQHFNFDMEKLDPEFLAAFGNALGDVPADIHARVGFVLGYYAALFPGPERYKQLADVILKKGRFQTQTELLLTLEVGTKDILLTI